jgi:hypothetical protein
VQFAGRFVKITFFPACLSLRQGFGYTFTWLKSPLTTLIRAGADQFEL